MPSSSSSDEDLAKFKEAADSFLYNDSLYRGKQAHKEEPATVPPPSLRFVDEDENDRGHNDLRVTPAFQKHVAKKLSKLLDSQLDSDASTQPNSSRRVLQAKRRKPVCSSGDDSNSSGVRLFGASAVFLSSMNIIPAPPRRPKRGRKMAHLRSGSDSSSDDSDSMKNVSAAAVSSDWLLSGEATKGWSNSKGKVESCVVDKSVSLVPTRNGYEALSEVSCSNNNSEENLNPRALKEKFKEKKREGKRKSSHIESDLAASFSSVVSIGSDSQGDTSNPTWKEKRHKMKKKRRKEQYSEDATTENTEVEEVVERRKKKCKKGRKKPKYQRVEEKECEEAQMIKDCVPGLLEENNDAKLKKIEKKRRKMEQKRRNEPFRDKSYLKVKRSSTVLKLKHTPDRVIDKKIRHLSADLAKLMSPEEIS